MSETLHQTAYEQIGGESGVRRLVNRFYDLMEQEPSLGELRAMHAQDLGPMRERLFEFMSGWLGGPPLYFERPAHACIMSAHLPYAIGTQERDQWLAAMYKALQETALSERTHKAIRQGLFQMAEAFRNR